MTKQFIQKPVWTDEQEKVLKSEPNLIISGCAGSGKTLLACQIAMSHSLTKKVVILVYTKSLRTFIQEHINENGGANISVMYEYEWRSRNFQNFDIIIVDEYQDFSLNDISNIINHASEGVYLFGDIEQKLYTKNFQKEPTLSLEELINITNFNHIKLKNNFRIAKENKNFIKQLYDDSSLNNSSFSSNSKPRIFCFKNIDDELNWIKNFLQNNSKFKNIGILLKQNDSFKGGYYHRRRLRKDKIYGILELHEFFKKNNIHTSYKYSNYDNLNFSNEFNINIMTYHSAKGLQFDCVILPFSNFVNDNNGKMNLPYVGLTRAINQIVITYSGLIADEYSNLISTDTFEGRIIRQSNNDNITEQQFMEIRTILSLKDKPGYEHLERKYKEYIDTSDCKIVKF